MLFRSFLDPFKEEKKEDIDRLKNIQQQIHDNFINYVKDRRGSKLDQEKLEEIFSGLFWVGNKAIDLGLADGVGSLKPILEKKFGKKIKIKMITQKKSFLQRRFSSSILNSEEVLNKIEERIMLSRFGL